MQVYFPPPSENPENDCMASFGSSQMLGRIVIRPKSNRGLYCHIVRLRQMCIFWHKKLFHISVVKPMLKMQMIEMVTY